MPDRSPPRGPLSSTHRDALQHSGASSFDDAGRPIHFGDPEAELRACFETCALVDQAALARLVGTGPDLLELLHRMSTADVKDLAPGEGKPTVLTTAKGRIVERLFVHHLGEAGLLLVGGAGSGPRVLGHIARYTFSENTGLSEATDATGLLALVGPAAGAALESAGLKLPSPGHVAAAQLDDAPVDLLGQDGLSTGGFGVFLPESRAASAWTALSDAVSRVGGRPAGSLPLEAYRVLRGIGASGHELTEEYNPLEAGLWDAVSFDKGCYVGQEVVARLNTYDKVSREIVGIDLPPAAAAPETGTPLFHDGRQVGKITSAVVPPGRGRVAALASVKKKWVRSGLDLEVGTADAALRARVVPFEDH